VSSNDFGTMIWLAWRIDQQRFTVTLQSLRSRPTDVDDARVVQELLAQYFQVNLYPRES
jgi:hypothetical protein